MAANPHRWAAPPLGLERQAHASGTAVGHHAVVEQRSEIAQHVFEDRHRLVERVAERHQALGLTRPDPEDETTGVEVVERQRRAGQVGGATTGRVGHRDAERPIGHRADDGPVAERVVEGVGVGGEVRQRDLAPQLRVEHAEDVVGRPVRIEADLLVDLQHLRRAPERELRREIDTDLHVHFFHSVDDVDANRGSGAGEAFDDRGHRVDDR